MGSMLGRSRSRSRLNCTDQGSFSPGRFFAVNEMKALLTYILLNYDIKLGQPDFPPMMWVEGVSSTEHKAVQVLFKKRVPENGFMSS